MSAERVLPAAWSIGMLSRLSRERELSAMAEGLVRRHLGDALGHAGGAGAATFDDGARGALDAIALRLALGGGEGAEDREDAWARWLEGLDAVAPADTEERERMLLAATETLLTRGPEPTSDKATFDAIGLIVSKLSWSKDSEARGWLVRWFTDRRVSAGDLHAVTMALVSRTRAQGVTQLMTLSAAASDKARREMREAYVVAWGLEQSVRLEGLLADWVSEAERALKLSPTDPAALLENSVRLSRLSEVGSLLWRGQSAEADALLEGIEVPLEHLRAESAGTKVGAPPGDAVNDGRWMLKYLEAGRNIPLRMSLLDDLGRQAAHLGAADAEILAREAMRGSPVELRDRARQVALAMPSNANLVNGVLEELPHSRRDAETSQFIETVARASLPPVRSPSWPAAARRAMVERLLELTASRGEFGWVDALSRQLGASYENRASSQPIPDEVPLTRTVPEAGDSCAALWHVWLASADTGRGGREVEALTRRRAGRVGLARGPVQRFAAEQVSVCELAAHVVEGERPSAGPEIELILADLADRRRRAGHIFDQIEAGERAMLRLWMARLTEGST